MGRGMILDTCFLIDLQREFRRCESARASRFLEANPSTRFSISVISVTEFLEGFAVSADGERLLRAFVRHDIDSNVASQASVIRRQLRQAGNFIGDFDILIAATAIIAGVPLVTRSTAEFERIEGLEIVTY